MVLEENIEHTSILEVIPSFLREAATTIKFNTGDYIVRNGDTPKHVHYVISGEIRLVRGLKTGDNIILQRTSSGFIAEASVDANMYQCDMYAAEDSQVTIYPLEAFNKALSADASFSQYWISYLDTEIMRLRCVCERLSLNSARARILHYIETEGKQGAITLTLSRKAWAEELGLTHEVVYRTLKQLQNEDVLNVDGAQLSLC